jgi:hypothetical protein
VGYHVVALRANGQQGQNVKSTSCNVFPLLALLGIHASKARGNPTDLSSDVLGCINAQRTGGHPAAERNGPGGSRILPGSPVVTPLWVLPGLHQGPFPATANSASRSKAAYDLQSIIQSESALSGCGLSRAPCAPSKRLAAPSKGTTRACLLGIGLLWGAVVIPFVGAAGSALQGGRVPRMEGPSRAT